jgi:NADPH2:quinone reductase
MKAIVVNTNGGPEVLQEKEIERKKPGPGQALLKIVYVGVNFIDIYQRKGIYSLPLPYIPGLEASGYVEEVGAGVTTVKPGDRVAYVHEPGAYAEESIVSAESLIKLPDAISLEQGAAFPLQGMTAHYLLHEFRKMKPGEIVLIHAAAGGMGLLLVQWAKKLGLRVFGTASTEEKVKIAKEAGAEEVINYARKDFASEIKRLTNSHGADLIIDGVSKTTFTGNLEAAALRGNIVIFGAASGPADPIVPNALMKKSLTISGGTLFNYLLSREELLMRANAVIEGIQQGWLKLHIDEVFPLSKASAAHRKLEERKSVGKILLSAGGK